MFQSGAPPFYQLQTGKYILHFRPFFQCYTYKNATGPVSSSYYDVESGIRLLNKLQVHYNRVNFPIFSLKTCFRRKWYVLFSLCSQLKIACQHCMKILHVAVVVLLMQTEMYSLMKVRHTCVLLSLERKQLEKKLAFVVNIYILAQMSQ